MDRNYDNEKINAFTKMLGHYMAVERELEQQFAFIKEQREILRISLSEIYGAQNNEKKLKEQEEQTKKEKEEQSKKVVLWREYTPQDNHIGDDRGKNQKWNPYTGRWVYWADCESPQWKISPCTKWRGGGCHMTKESGKECAYYHELEEKKNKDDYTYDHSKIEWKTHANDEEYYRHYGLMRKKCHDHPRWWESKALECKLCQ
jgi:hypothetical protein